MRASRVDEHEDEKESVVRTFRLPVKRDRLLTEEAKEKGITLNAMMNSVLTEHQDWLKRATESGFVWIHRSSYRAIIEELDDETLRRIGRTVVPEWVEDMSRYMFQSTDPERILDTLEVRYTHDPLMRVNFIREKGNYTLVFTHDMGPKFSILAEAVTKELVTKYFRVEPETTRGESVVTVKFRTKNPPTTVSSIDSRHANHQSP